MNCFSFLKSLLDDQLEAFRAQGFSTVDKLMPPVAGSLKWSKSLKARVEHPIQCFNALDHPWAIIVCLVWRVGFETDELFGFFRIVRSKEAQSIMKEVDDIVVALDRFEKDLLERWKATAPQKCEELLKLPLFSRRSRCNELQLNFHPEVYFIFYF